MVYEKVLCPYCKSDNVVKNGRNSTGRQRMMCRNSECKHKTFQLEYSNNASKPGVKEKIIDMVMNGSGTRDTGRVLKISPNTVTAVLKKQKDWLNHIIRLILYQNWKYSQPTDDLGSNGKTIPK